MTLQNCPQVYVAMARARTSAIHLFTEGHGFKVGSKMRLPSSPVKFLKVNGHF
jgi:hypothetical protein